MTWWREWTSCDGLSYVEVRVFLAEPPWPSLVAIEPDALSSMLPDDARALAAVLVEAADEAERDTASVLEARNEP